MRRKFVQAEMFPAPAPPPLPSAVDQPWPPEGRTLVKRDPNLIAKAKEVLDEAAIANMDPIVRRAFYEELVAEAKCRLEALWDVR